MYVCMYVCKHACMHACMYRREYLTDPVRRESRVVVVVPVSGVRDDAVITMTKKENPYF